jgi:hypothetical protein
MKFAKLFEVEDDNQVLVTMEYDSNKDSHELKFRTDIEGLDVAISIGCDSEENCREVYNDVTIKAATAIRDDMLKMIG